MSEAHLRQTTRDLYDAARELREEELAAVEADRAALVEEATAEYGTPSEAPTRMHRRYEELTRELQELIGTAETYEHYADEWSADGETCAFTIEELNGDEYAAVVDAVSAEAAAQAREEESIPEGYGRVKALEYGVVDLPPNAPTDPGRWPAPIVEELFGVLNSITAPSGTDLGNESLGSAMRAGSTGSDIPGAK